MPFLLECVKYQLNEISTSFQTQHPRHIFII